MDIDDEINKCKNDINYWFYNYYRGREESGFIIPKPRSSNTTVSEYLYRFEMKRLIGFLPDYMKQKLISDEKRN